MMVQDYINSLYEEMILLCEIRGELDDEANARTEKRLAEIKIELRKFEVDAVV